MSGRYGTLDASRHYGPPLAVTGITLPFAFLFLRLFLISCVPLIYLLRFEFSLLDSSVSVLSFIRISCSYIFMPFLFLLYPLCLLVSILSFESWLTISSLCSSSEGLAVSEQEFSPYCMTTPYSVTAIQVGSLLDRFLFVSLYLKLISNRSSVTVWFRSISDRRCTGVVKFSAP